MENSVDEAIIHGTATPTPPLLLLLLELELDIPEKDPLCEEL
jgi:hypothetical protein